MKKLIAMLLALTMVFALAACSSDDTTETEATTEATAEATTEATEAPEATTEAPEATTTAMTYAEYIAADLETEVTVEVYVQATQSWWDNTITVYAQDTDGGYFIYNMACSEEDAASLTAGTKIIVTGYKSEWSGEVEIVDATFTFADDGDTYIAEPVDVTELLGTDELIDHQNEKVSFTGLTVEAVEYKNGTPGDDIYVTVSYNGESYDFCVEYYLTDDSTEVYATVGELEAGDTIDVEGFLYWYEGVNTHITSVTVTE